MLNRTGQRVWLIVALLMAAALLGGLLQPAGRAFAHPLGNFTINRYARIELYRDTIRIHYALDIAEIPTLQLAADIDTDGDQTLSPAELTAWAQGREQEVASRMELSMGGTALRLRPAGRTATVAEGQAGLNVLRVAYVFEAPAGGDEVSAIRFTDHNYEGRAGWREIVVRPSAGAEVAVEPRFLAERSEGLTAYPASSLTGAPDDQRVDFTWRAGSGSAAPAVTLGAEGAIRGGRSGFASLLDNNRSAGVILFSLLAALGFGALHALGPGHGKSVVAAYLVGSRGTARHALALGLTVTATHTSTVYLLGFVTLALSQYLVPEQLYLYLGVASGAMVVVMGVILFVGRLRGLRRRGSAANGHRHGPFGRTHSHEPHPHEHPHEGEHAHGEEPQGTPEAAPRVGWRGLLTLGVAGGLLPCPSAIVVMLAAISLGQVVFGMLLIVAFSLGLAGVLMAIGLALVWGRRLSGRSRAVRALQRPGLARLAAAFPVVTALGLTAAGAVITYQAWNQPGL